MPEAHSHVGRGAVTAALLGLSFVGITVGPRARALARARVSVYADFNTITGLRSGSPVQLAGVKVGTAKEVDYVRVQYACDPLSEDIGRYGQGRTDSCDQNLFCAPTGQCATLERYAGPGHHPRCDSTHDCRDDEICFSGAFSRREPHVQWAGPRGVCAHFSSSHTRTRVRMEVPADIVHLIRADSRAMIASNSVLGDQMINITAGRGDELCPLLRHDIPNYSYAECLSNMRVQARPSLSEDVDRLRERVEHFMEKADNSILSLISVIDQLRGKEVIEGVSGIASNTAFVTHHLATGRGVIGALVNSRGYKREVTETLRALNSTANGLAETGRRLNAITAKVDRNIEPMLAEVQALLRAVDSVLQALDSPANRSLARTLMYDTSGESAQNLGRILAGASQLSGTLHGLATSIEQADGTLGLLVRDDRVVENIGRLLSVLATRDGMRAVTLWYLEKRLKAISIANARESGR